MMIPIYQPAESNKIQFTIFVTVFYLSMDEIARGICLTLVFKNFNFFIEILNQKTLIEEIFYLNLQHIGLDWLVTMHDRKLNGILADEMGLGKVSFTQIYRNFLIKS